VQLTRAEIHERVVAIVEKIVDDDLEFDELDNGITDDTLLTSDLGMESLHYVEMAVAIEEGLGRKIGFHDLMMGGGRHREDLRVSELVDFIDGRVNPAEHSTPEVRTDSAGSVSIRHRLTAATLDRFKAIVPQGVPLRVDPARGKNRPAAFVLCAPRSGSTLFRVMLAGHPRLFAPPELHLLQYPTLDERRRVYSYEVNNHLLEGTIRAVMHLYAMDAEGARRFMEECESREMPSRECYAMLQDRLGERLLIDKTPAYSYSSEFLRRAELYFEDPLFIHLVRHPYASFRSFLDAKLDRFFPFMWRNRASFSPEEFAELNWLLCNRNITEFLSAIPVERQLAVRFEELVEAPRPTMVRVSEFLGVPFDQEMIEPYKEKDQRMTVGAAKVSRMAGDLKFYLHQKIDPEASTRWKRFDTGEGLSDLTWDLARSLGYQKN